MKVSELISLLLTLEPGLEVVVSGYEGGYSSVRGVSEPREYVQNVNDEWYYGSHEPLDYQLELEYMTREEAEAKGIFRGVVIY